MADEQSSSEWKFTVLGFVMIALVLGAVGYVIHAGYVRWIRPAPGVVTLSAYFVDDSGKPVCTSNCPKESQGHLQIKGDVYQNGHAAKAGTVRITVEIDDPPFNQSVSVPVVNGHFDIQDAAFSAIHPGKAMAVTADVAGTDAAGKDFEGTATVLLNKGSPIIEWSIGAGLAIVPLLMAVFFFYAFTGKKTATKNRVAIIYSYVVIFITLALPMAAPVLLFRFVPEAVDAMIGQPAGLVVTRTPNKPEGETQWVLNVGGYSYVSPMTPNTKTNVASGEAVTEEKKTTTSETQATGSSASPAPTPSKNDSQSNVATSTVPKGGAALAPAPLAKPHSDETLAKPGTNSSTPPALASETTNKTPASQRPSEADSSDRNASESERLKPPVAEVEGGLVIPLYVIILSVFGGAINMTRKVPEFQREGEESEFRPLREISYLGTRVAGSLPGLRPQRDETPSPDGQVVAETPAQTELPTDTEQIAPTTPTNTPERSIEEQAKQTDDELDSLLAEQIKRNADSQATVAKIQTLLLTMQEFYSKQTDGPLLGFASYADWFAGHPRLRQVLGGNWRVELLNQYMYLISAPFLAIVTYYILDLLGLSKQGVVVVLSFSVGLVSEKIVGWILGVATGYLRTDAGAQKATTT